VPYFAPNDKSVIGADYSVQWNSHLTKKMTIKINVGIDGNQMNSEPLIWTSPSLISNKKDDDPIMFKFDVPKGLDCTFIKVSSDNSLKV